MLRPLNSLEHAFWHADAEVPLNFVLVARIEGPLTLDILRAALTRQIARFPALAWSISGGTNDEPHFVKAATLPRVDVVTGGGWQGQLSRELNTPFDCPAEPICRLKWVRDHETSHILMTFHHAIADGRSGLSVLTHLLEDASAYVAGAQVPRHVEPTMLLSGVIQPSSRPSQLRYGRGVLRWPQGPKALSQRRMGAVPLSLSGEESYAILHRARLYGVSVTGMFGAAHLLALAEHFDQSGLLSLSMPIDWRSRVEGVASDAFGLLVGEGRVVYRINPADEFWSLARRMTGDIKRLAPAAPAHHALETGQDGAAAIYDKRASTAISNLGVVRQLEIHPPFVVHDMFMAVSCGVFGDQIATILSYNGRMNVLFCVAVPTVSPSAAEAVVRLTKERLLNACRPSES